MCYWYRTLLLQYVLLVQNVVATVCVSGTERCCYSMCYWYRTLLLQYVLLIQNVVAAVCVTGTERCCYSMCYWYRTMLASYAVDHDFKVGYKQKTNIGIVCFSSKYSALPVTHTVATTFCTSNTYCSNNVLYQ
jgi:hypothetical protein